MTCDSYSCCKGIVRALEHCKLPSGVWVEPRWKLNLCILALKSDVCGNNFTKFPESCVITEFIVIDH